MPLINRKEIKHRIYSYLHHRRVTVSELGARVDEEMIHYRNYRHSSGLVNMVPILDMQNPYSCFVFRFSGVADCQNTQEVSQTTPSQERKTKILAVSGFTADESIYNFSFTHLWKEKDTGFMLSVRESITSIIQDFFTGDVAMSSTTWGLVSKALNFVGLDKLSNEIENLRTLFVNSKIVFPERELKIYDGIKLNVGNNYTVEKIYVTKTNDDPIYSEIIKDIETLDLWPKVYFIDPNKGKKSIEEILGESSPDKDAPPIVLAYRRRHENEAYKTLYETLKLSYVIGYVLLGYYFYSYFDKIEENAINKETGELDKEKAEVENTEYAKKNKYPNIVSLIHPLFEFLPYSDDDNAPKGYITPAKKRNIYAHCIVEAEEGVLPGEADSEAQKSWWEKLWDSWNRFWNAFGFDKGDCFCGSVGGVALIILEMELDNDTIAFETGDNQNALGLFKAGTHEDQTIIEANELRYTQNPQKVEFIVARPLKLGEKHYKIKYTYQTEDPLGENMAYNNISNLKQGKNNILYLNKIATKLFFNNQDLLKYQEELTAIAKEIIQDVMSQYKEYVDTWESKPLNKENGYDDKTPYINKFKEFLAKITSEDFKKKINLSDFEGLSNAPFDTYGDIVKAIGTPFMNLIRNTRKLSSKSEIDIGNPCNPISRVSSDILAFFRSIVLTPPSSYSFIPFFTEYVEALVNGWPTIKINNEVYTIGYYGIVLLNTIRNVPAQEPGVERSIYYLLPEDVEVQFSNSFVYDAGIGVEKNVVPKGRPLWGKLRITFKPINEYIHLYGNFLGLRQLLLLLKGSETSSSSSSSGGGGYSGSSSVALTGAGQSFTLSHDPTLCHHVEEKQTDGSTKLVPIPIFNSADIPPRQRG